MIASAPNLTALLMWSLFGWWMSLDPCTAIPGRQYNRLHFVETSPGAEEQSGWTSLASPIDQGRAGCQILGYAQTLFTASVRNTA